MIGLLLTYLAGAVAIVVLYWFYIYFNFRRYLRNVWSPPAYPIIGSAFMVSNSAELLSLPLKYMKERGYVIKFIMGFDTMVFIADPKVAEFFMSNPKFNDKAAPYNFLHGWLGTGLLTSTGEKWRKRRKMITPAYHFQILEQFIDVFEANNNVLIEKLKKEVGRGSTDIYPYITLCALDNICETAMGTSVNAQQNKDSEYIQCVKKLCYILTNRAFSGFKRYDFLYKLTPMYRDEVKSVKILHNYTMEVIGKRREQLLKKIPSATKEINDNDIGSKKRVAFLDLLLQSTIDGQPLTDTDIREEVDTFMFEGHDTTASGISFTLHCLATNPEAQAKVVEEQKQIFGAEPHKSPTHTDLQNMKYLELVIKEALRLYPSVPMYGREIKEDVKIDDMVFEKGSQIGIMPYCLHRNPELFPEPERFNPDRFTDGSVNIKYPYAYIPFSAGPRNCIGQKFAMLELKSVVSKVIRNFELRPVVPEHKMILVGETIIKSSNGILMQLEKRDW